MIWVSYLIGVKCEAYFSGAKRNPENHACPVKFLPCEMRSIFHRGGDHFTGACPVKFSQMWNGAADLTGALWSSLCPMSFQLSALIFQLIRYQLWAKLPWALFYELCLPREILHSRNPLGYFTGELSAIPQYLITYVYPVKCEAYFTGAWPPFT